jgi:hypothetical protein
MGFRFVGREGVMDLGDKLTLSRRPPLPADWDSPPASGDELTALTSQTFAPPDGYDSRLDHFRNFFAACRTREPVVEDGLFGLRAAAPALLCNRSYEEGRPVAWNPETFEVTVG